MPRVTPEFSFRLAPRFVLQFFQRFLRPVCVPKSVPHDRSQDTPECTSCREFTRPLVMAATPRRMPVSCEQDGQNQRLRGHPKPANEGHLKTGQR